MFKNTRLLTVLALMFLAAPKLFAQENIYRAVIDGTQNPPQIVFSDANIGISDSGTGRYVLTFDTPVIFLLGASLSQGGGFDVAPTFFSATRNSADRRQVSVGILQIPLVDNAAHGKSDAVFSLKFILESPIIYEDGFE